MVVAAAVVLMFVTGHAVVESHFAGKAAFGQQLQRAVHRRKADPRIAALHQLMQLLGREVVVGFQKRPQDRIALSGVFQSDALQVAVEILLGLADRLVREFDMVINAFWQDSHR